MNKEQEVIKLLEGGIIKGRGIRRVYDAEDVGLCYLIKQYSYNQAIALLKQTGSETCNCNSYHERTGLHVEDCPDFIKQPECATCGGSKRKPRKKHCELNICCKNHECITCSPDGKYCEYYIPSEPCPDCQKPAKSLLTTKEKTTPITEPGTGAKKGEVASQPPVISMAVAVDDCDITDKPSVPEGYLLVKADSFMGKLEKCSSCDTDKADCKTCWQDECYQEPVEKPPASEFTKKWRIKHGEPMTYNERVVNSACDIIDKLEALRDTVQISCNPPKDCNDPVVLKTYMKGCFDEAMKL